jgi:hypothetical protein
MDTYELIAVCRQQRTMWRERFLELDSRQAELTAKSEEAIARSRAALGAALPAAALAPFWTARGARPAVPHAIPAGRRPAHP